MLSLLLKCLNMVSEVFLSNQGCVGKLKCTLPTATRRIVLGQFSVFGSCNPRLILTAPYPGVPPPPRARACVCVCVLNFQKGEFKKFQRLCVCVCVCVFGSAIGLRLQVLSRRGRCPDWSTQGKFALSEPDGMSSCARLKQVCHFLTVDSFS